MGRNLILAQQHSPQQGETVSSNSSDKKLPGSAGPHDFGVNLDIFSDYLEFDRI